MSHRSGRGRRAHVSNWAGVGEWALIAMGICWFVVQSWTVVQVGEDSRGYIFPNKGLLTAAKEAVTGETKRVQVLEPGYHVVEPGEEVCFAKASGEHQIAFTIPLEKKGGMFTRAENSTPPLTVSGVVTIGLSPDVVTEKVKSLESPDIESSLVEPLAAALAANQLSWEDLGEFRLGVNKTLGPELKAQTNFDLKNLSIESAEAYSGKGGETSIGGLSGVLSPLDRTPWEVYINHAWKWVVGVVLVFVCLRVIFPVGFLLATGIVAAPFVGLSNLFGAGWDSPLSWDVPDMGGGVGDALGAVADVVGDMDIDL